MTKSLFRCFCIIVFAVVFIVVIWLRVYCFDRHTRRIQLETESRDSGRRRCVPVPGGHRKARRTCHQVQESDADRPGTAKPSADHTGWQDLRHGKLSNRTGVHIRRRQTRSRGECYGFSLIPIFIYFLILSLPRLFYFTTIV